MIALMASSRWRLLSTDGESVGSKEIDEVPEE
jgi:hypothetical protein